MPVFVIPHLWDVNLTFCVTMARRWCHRCHSHDNRWMSEWATLQEVIHGSSALWSILLVFGKRCLLRHLATPQPPHGCLPSSLSSWVNKMHQLLYRQQAGWWFENNQVVLWCSPGHFNGADSAVVAVVLSQNNKQTSQSRSHSFLWLCFRFSLTRSLIFNLQRCAMIVLCTFYPSCVD